MKTNLNVVKRSKLYLSIAIIFTLASVAAIFFKGLNYGIDFTGGNIFQLRFEEKVTLADLNPKLDEISKNISELKSRKVQVSEGNVVIIRTPEMAEETKTKFIEESTILGKYTVEKIDKVGASIGKELKTSAIYSLIIGMILIASYITIRYEFKFAIGGILSLLHDVLFAVGAIALLGYEVNTEFIAAVLTILGYSINDTIVIFDRIREKLRVSEDRKKLTFGDILNIGLNDVMIRSINTSVTTLLAAVAIFIFGGDSLKTFIVTLIVGVAAGTYSSVFIATPIVYLLDKDRDGRGTINFKSDEDEDYKEKIIV
ncbi:MAG: protein translocase subunit SecF [Fusobacteriaceae bacterium]